MHTVKEKDTLPRRVIVKRIVSSRYAENLRPLSWDERKEGEDTIESGDGATVKLLSDGQQSPPKPGWVLLLTSGDDSVGYRWTLYGIRPTEQ